MYIDNKIYNEQIEKHVLSNVLAHTTFVHFRPYDALFTALNNPLQASNNAKNQYHSFLSIISKPLLRLTYTNQYSMYISNNDAFALPQQLKKDGIE